MLYILTKYIQNIYLTCINYYWISKVKIAYAACIIFILDSAELESW